MLSSQFEAFYDGTLKPTLDAIDDRRRQARWLIAEHFAFVETVVRELNVRPSEMKPALEQI